MILLHVFLEESIQSSPEIPNGGGRRYLTLDGFLRVFGVLYRGSTTANVHVQWHNPGNVAVYVARLSRAWGAAVVCLSVRIGFII